MDENSTNGEKNNGNRTLGPAALVVPFVACGDLHGFDSDKSYPLTATAAEPACLDGTAFTGQPTAVTSATGAPTPPTECGKAGSKAGEYTFVDPVQPPIRPNYYSYLLRQQQ